MTAGTILLALILSPIIPSTDGPGSRELLTLVRDLTGQELVKIGEIHDVQNHFLEALTYYEQARASFKAKKQHREEAGTLVKIAAVQEREGRRRAAVVSLQDALALFSKFPGDPKHADALLALGRLSAWLGSREQSARLLEEAVTRFSGSRQYHGRALAMIELGLMRVSDGREKDGIGLIQQALDESRRRGDEAVILKALLALGDARWLMDEPDPARLCYVEALALAKRRLDAELQAALHRRLASLSETIGQPENGIEPAKESIRLYQTLRRPSAEAASWALLASLYGATGQQDYEQEAIQRALLLQSHQHFAVHAGG